MIVLDAHAWIWWMGEPATLSSAARAAVEAADRIGIASISAWEVGMLVSRGRWTLHRAISE